LEAENLLATKDTNSTKVKTSQTADSDHVKAEVTRKKAG
jgi:hypothetical protein